MKLTLLCLLLPACLLAADVRIVSYSGGVLIAGVSTPAQQFQIVSSNDRTNWIDRGRTWVIRGTNEILLSIQIPATNKSTFVKLVR